jgi:hypothetical protein
MRALFILFVDFIRIRTLVHQRLQAQDLHRPTIIRERQPVNWDPRHKRRGIASSGNARVICDAGTGWPRRFGKANTQSRKYRYTAEVVGAVRTNRRMSKIHFRPVLRRQSLAVQNRFLASAAKSSSPSAEDPVEPNTLENRSEYDRRCPPNMEKHTGTSIKIGVGAAPRKTKVVPIRR